MSNWQFLVVRHYGSSQRRREVCAQIKTIVERRGLATVLPSVKYEVGRRGEYYLGIAINKFSAETSEWAISEARSVLTEVGIQTANNPQYSPIVEADQVARLLQGNLECENFTVPIAYENKIEEDLLDINELLSLDDSTEFQSTIETQNYDRLLYWCSAIGAGDIKRVKTACQLLNISIEWGGAWSVVRKLILLGHLECTKENTIRWGIVQPVLITPSVDTNCRFLAGQRTPNLINALMDKHQIDLESQVGGPQRIMIQDEEKTTQLKTYFNKDIINAGCVSRKLSLLFPNVNQWIEKLPVWDEVDFERYQIEEYQPEMDQFVNLAPPAEFGEGLYRFSMDRGNRQIVTLAFHCIQTGKWICGDFYGLRFLARHRSETCKAIYSQANNMLFIPQSDRWPFPYERALVIASGLLPRNLQMDSGKIIMSYSGIDEDLALRLCGLLNVDLEQE